MAVRQLKRHASWVGAPPGAVRRDDERTDAGDGDGCRGRTPPGCPPAGRSGPIAGGDGHGPQHTPPESCANAVFRAWARTSVPRAPVPGRRGRKRKNPGDDLFSRKAALSVSSALESLTSVFGMGTGVASPLESPGSSASGCVSARYEISDLRADGSIAIPAADPWSVAEEVKPSTISTAQLHPSPDFHMRPIKQVVSLRSYPVDPVGNLISRRASHLDAFSAYPDRT